MTRLVWLRNDLRLEDNPALAAAAASGEPVAALYITTPATWQRHLLAPRKADLLRRRLQALRQEFAAVGIPLYVRSCPWFSDTPAVVGQLMAELGATTLHFNREWLLDEQRRDGRVERLLQAAGLRVCSHHDGLLLVPGSVCTASGEMFKVYTPFRRAVLRQLLNQGIPPLSATPKVQAMAAAGDDAAAIDAAFVAVPQQPSPLFAASRSALWQQLSDFLDGPLNGYALHRDQPALNATSQLSAAFSIGAIGMAETLNALLLRAPAALEVGDGGAASWLNELIWREFYRHLCALKPSLVMEKAFKPETEHLPWRQADDDFAAWCSGQTGFPIIDAAMRQLLATGWMHNRLRMLVASFLSKHLLIDWRRGAHFFMRHLVDGDFAANNGGWQWAASTGCDAAPYFRIFNPVSQSQRFDADGAFIRYWLPQLNSLNAKVIHDPHGLAPAAAAHLAYPRPIVDLGQGRARALAAFSALK